MNLQLFIYGLKLMKVHTQMTLLNAGRMLCLFLLLFFGLPANVFSAEQDASATLTKQAGKTEDLLKPTREMSAIASIVTTVIAKQHYQKKPLNAQTSRELFDLYLKSLDPQRVFFLQSDIDEFNYQRDQLCAQLQRGDVQFAFDVFNRLMERWKAYEAFAKEYLNGDIDFTVDESFEFDHSKAPWAKDENELKELWRKRIKNDLIVAILSDRATEQDLQQEKAEKDSSGQSGSETGSPQEKNTTEEAAPVSSEHQKTPKERILYRISQVSSYYDNMTPMDVMEGYLSRYAGVFDPHSSYMSPQTDEAFNIAISLSLVGIGAVLSSEDGYTKVNEIVPGGPADLDGRLKAGDRIIAVQQEDGDPVDVVDMPLNKVVELIRGKRGTQVTLTVLEGSKGLQAIPKKIVIVRDKVQLKESEAKGQIREITLDDGSVKKIGVIMLPSFYFDFEGFRRNDPDAKSSSSDVARILKDFEKEKIDGLVIDLRSNGGGSLLEAINLSGLFIPEGPMVQVRDRNGIQVENDHDNG